MFRTRKSGALVLATTLLLAAAPVAAQDESSAEPMEMAEPDIVVSGVDYAFVGLPTSVPAGTTLGFQNDGTEMHELAVINVLDETTSLEELMAMPEEESNALIQFVGFAAAVPGSNAEGTIDLASPGRYLAVCFVPQGTDPEAFLAAGVDLTMIDETTDPETMSPEAQALFEELQSNPTHMELGMVQEFTVTEAGTEVGPLPDDAGDGEDAMDDGESSGDDSSE